MLLAGYPGPLASVVALPRPRPAADSPRQPLRGSLTGRPSGRFV